MQQTPATRRPGVVQLPKSRGPLLRVVGGGLDEAVLRRKQFEGEHPDIVIAPPGPHTGWWTARRDGTILASGYQLSILLDTLGWLLS